MLKLFDQPDGSGPPASRYVVLSVIIVKIFAELVFTIQHRLMYPIMVSANQYAKMNHIVQALQLLMARSDVPIAVLSMETFLQ